MMPLRLAAAAAAAASIAASNHAIARPLCRLQRPLLLLLRL